MILINIEDFNRTRNGNLSAMKNKMPLVSHLIGIISNDQF